MSKKGSILLVEDDISIGSILFDLIKQSNYEVKWAKDGVEGMDCYSKGNFTCILLDVMMPRKNGYTLLSEIRSLDKDIPIIMLTAKSEIEDKKEAFNLGADDYVVKPFEWEELELRLDSKHRSLKPQNKNIKIASAVFSPEKQLISYSNGDEQKLTGRESQILNLLGRRKNEAVDRETILKHIWGIDSYQNSRSLDVFISRLRSYIKELDGVEIRNIHGKGFELHEA